MTIQIVIGIVGLPGSGKSTALEFVKDLAPIITMGDVIRDEVLRRGLEINTVTLGEISKQIREEEGDQIVAKKCIEKIKSTNEATVFVDGIRSMDEVNLFRKHWNFQIIAIICDEDVRYKRLSERGRSDDSLISNDIIERDKREVYFGLTEVIGSADYKVQNNSDIESLKKNIREVIKNILRE